MWSLATLFCSNNTVLSLLNNAPVRTQEFVHWQSNRPLEGTNKTLCVPEPRTKEQWPHKRLTQTCPWVTRSLQWRYRLAVACCRAGGTECSSAGMGPAEGGHHYLHYLHCSLASGQINGREHSPAHQQKIGLKITEHGPAHQNKTQCPPQSISPIRKFP